MDDSKVVEFRKSAEFKEADFFPKGAIAFFASLLVFFALIWLSIYGLMIFRKFGI